jgi:hypothetical protein
MSASESLTPATAPVLAWTLFEAEMMATGVHVPSALVTSAAMPLDEVAGVGLGVGLGVAGALAVLQRTVLE